MNLGILASHEGTTLQSIMDACADARIPGRVAVVISNNSRSGALTRAQHAGVRTAHLSATTHPHPAALDVAIRDVLIEAEVDVVFLAGYMKRLGPEALAHFEGRVLNTHPALLPRFGGTGMYGDRVHAAVLAAGDSHTGVSLHVVDSDYDTGRVVRQCAVAVLPDDSLATLRARVQAREKEFIVECLGQIARGQVTLFSSAGGRASR